MFAELMVTLYNWLPNAACQGMMWPDCSQERVIHMNATLRSAVLEIAVKPKGAELCSLKAADGTQYIWQADAAVWPRHAPILFPIVGRLASDKYTLGNRTYEMKQHGFARDCDFELAQKTSNTIGFRLASSAATRKVYPFDFTMWARYKLIGNALDVTYEVTNNGTNLMPFSVGAHPAFALSWNNTDTIEDYYLQFEVAENAATHFLNQDHLLSTEMETMLKGQKRLALTKNLFYRDALIFLDLKSTKVSLCSAKHAKKLTVEFPGFPFLGIWAKPAAPFVCIEPWFGHADPADADGLIMNKPGIVKLHSGRSFRCTHRIVIDTR